MTTSPTAHTRFTNALQKSIQYTNSMTMKHHNIISAPASPEPNSSDFGFNSDDLVPTSAIDVQDDDDDEEEQQHHHHHSRSTSSEPASLVIVGNYQQRFTLGRGGSCTFKIGRRNRQISRSHVAIEYAHGRFELVVLGLNGASVDHLPYRQHERAPLDDHSFVDVLGDTFIFRLPAVPPQKQQQINPTTLPMNNKEQQQQQPTIDSSHLSVSLTENDVAQQVDQQHERVLDQDNVVIPVSPSPSSPHVDEIEQEEKETGTNLQQQHDLSLQTMEMEATIKKDTSSESTETKPVTMNTPIKDDTNDQIQQQEEDEDDNSDDDKENNHASTNQEDTDTTDYAENIIDILVFSRKSSMPISDICSRIIKTNPSYKKQDREVWTQRIQRVLKEKAFFGEIVRKGKTADGSPKEHLYYYNSDMDPVEWRRATYTQVGRSARKCTLQDKQYFWRIPPKLGKNRNAYIPPPAPATSSPLQEKRKLDENVDDLSMKKQKH